MKYRIQTKHETTLISEALGDHYSEIVEDDGSVYVILTSDQIDTCLDLMSNRITLDEDSEPDVNGLSIESMIDKLTT